MKLLIPTTIAALSTLPAFGWTLGPRRLFGPSLLADTSMMIPSPMELLREQRELMKDGPFAHTSPRYEIKSTDEEMKISVDVPGVNKDDIHVAVEDNVLSISGHRELEKEGYSYKSKFSQSFSLDPSIEIDKFSAELNNGVLVITAPKDMKRLEQNIRKIPITASADDQLEDAKVDDINEKAAVDV